MDRTLVLTALSTFCLTAGIMFPLVMPFCVSAPSEPAPVVHFDCVAETTIKLRPTVGDSFVR